MTRLLQVALVAATTALASNLDVRALPDAPDGYAPQAGSCPSTAPSVRAATGLSSSETQWLTSRRNNTVSAMTTLFSGLNISGFDAASYIRNHSSQSSDLPNIALAFSGGGYRAMLTGAGAIQAYDSREKNAPGGLGGLLQSSTYVAGLSGGGWLVGSVFLNNFTTISALQSSVGDLWNLTEAVYDSPDTDTTASREFYTDVVTDLLDKQKAGFPISGADFWGRILSYRFVNATDGGVDYTWSSIRDQPGFSTGSIPYPIMVSDNRLPGQTVFSSLNNTLFELAPFEIGTWDPTIYGFVDTEYLGTNFSNGKVVGNQCVRGFDNAGLLVGTTSSYQSSAAGALLSSTGLPANVTSAIAPLVSEISADDGFVAYFAPNPFKNWDPTGNGANVGSDSDTLYLVDGGTDAQNLPLEPLIQPARAVDIIIAVDSSNDVNQFPNGSALYATYQRSQQPIANGTAFPTIPDTNTFINLGLNLRPTFFGCNESSSAMLVYVPNAPYTTLSNTSTFQLAYTYDQRDALIANGALVATQGNGTANAEFRACLGCAILARSFNRTKTAIPAACQTCFNSYCWNGTTASQTPSTPYYPNLIGAAPAGMGLNVTGGSGSSGNSSSGSGSGGGSGSGSGSGTSDANRVSGNTLGLLLALSAGVMLL